MSEKVDAKANPEKRLFISLITRDITLEDAFLDLIDNSINAAISQENVKLDSPEDYFQLANAPVNRVPHRIDLDVDPDKVVISDDSGGISFRTAREEVFIFGRKEGSGSQSDRLSVYGIGLKRALFKIGKQLVIHSAHPQGGFELDLYVPQWESDPKQPWTIPISPTDRNSRPHGTQIHITELNEDVSTRIADSSFLQELRDRISRTYLFFLGRLVEVRLNDRRIDPADIGLGENFATDRFARDGVECLVAAGIAKARGNRYVAENSGWFVFCNGRAVVYADKTPLTGWGSFLPTHQPKHRPFLGYVIFAAKDGEKLPWSTTKTDLNEESLVWQTAKRMLVSVGKPIVNFLDRRYKDGGVEIRPKDLAAISGPARAITAPIAIQKREFAYRDHERREEETSIQFKVRKKDLDRIKTYIGRRNMSNSDVGRYTFTWFLENEVDG